MRYLEGNKRLFILQGNGSILNRGCEAILRSTVDILRAEFGPCSFLNAPASSVHPAGYEEADPDVFHVIPPAVLRWRPRWWSAQFQQTVLRRQPRMPFERHLPGAAAVLAIGGDNYSLDYGLPDQFFRAARVTLDYRKPMVLWGASVGPFSDQPGFERFAAKELRDVSLICARESLTVEYLSSLGVTENVRLCADPAFTLSVEPVQLTPEEQLILEEPCIGLNLSPLAGRYRSGGNSQDWSQLARECMRALAAATDMPLVLIPHVILPENDDHGFMKALLDGIKGHPGRIVLLDSRYNARQLKWVISRLAVFIGARTHATVAALSSHVPTISLGYSMKAEGINRDIFGHANWVISVKTLSPQMLVERTTELLGQADPVRQHLESMMPAYRQRVRLGVRHLRDVLERYAGMLP
jgi:polysaccharide pyruvyl transferase WcaK-like protein